jgi:hypothetical protein
MQNVGYLNLWRGSNTGTSQCIVLKKKYYVDLWKLMDISYVDLFKNTAPHEIQFIISGWNDEQRSVIVYSFGVLHRHIK